MTRFYLTLSGLMFLAGCSSGNLVRNAPDATAPADFPNHTAEQIIWQLASRDSLIGSYRSDGRLHVDSPEMSQGIGMSVRASMVDTLYAQLRGPLALDVGRALVTGDSIFAHDKLNRKFYYGALSTVENYVPGGGAPGLLSRTLIGAIYPTLTEGATVTVESDSLLYRVTVTGLVIQRWVIDPSVWRVVSMEELSPTGEVRTSRAFAEFDVIDQLVLPRHVTLSSPMDNLTVTMEHRNLTVNPEELSYPFSRPRDVEKIRLE